MMISEDQAQATPDAEPAGEPDAEQDAPTIGEQLEAEAYADFRRDLEALPNHDAFAALVKQYGAEHGYRTIGRWIVGRGPKPKTPK